VAERPVLHVPHPVLKRVCRELVPDETAEIARVAGDLLDTMRGQPKCVGIAAPQIAEEVRMVAIDCTDHPKATVQHGLLVLVNPRIVESDGAEVGREGCLSIPDFTANVRRATHVVVEAFEVASGGDLIPRRIETETFEARLLQHEIDHLEGLLFLDRVDSMARDVFRRKNYG
jgi:peptide deformylase